MITNSNNSGVEFDDVIIFEKEILMLKKKADDLYIDIEVLKMEEERIIQDDEDNNRIKNYSKIANAWYEAKSKLDEIFYLISDNYNDVPDWKLNYPELSKPDYYKEKREQLLEQDEAEKESWDDFANDGLDDFYEGYDETTLGID